MDCLTKFSIKELEKIEQFWLKEEWTSDIKGAPLLELKRKIAKEDEEILLIKLKNNVGVVFGLDFKKLSRF
jgi:hypothetical protein